MKISLYSLVVFFFLVFIPPGKAQLKANIASHPRILLLQGEEKQLFEAIKQDSYKFSVHQEILKQCESILKSVPVERKKIGMRLLSKSREALLRISYLSYAWRMTDDTRYLKRAEKELLAISAFSDWNPSHFLDVAEMTIAASIGYDWLYGHLPPESRSIIRNAIIQKGLEPSFDSKNNWWLKAPHNWNQVCNAGMTIGALAVYEDSVSFCQSIIERSRQSIQLPMKDYEPDGAYPEGYMYWGYGTTFNVLLISALEKAFGEEFDLSKSKGFLASASYLQNMTGPSGGSFNFSDSDVQGALQPAMFWFSQKANDASLLWVEKDHIKNLGQTSRENLLRLLPLVLIWGKDSNMEQIPSPQNRIWAGKGKTPVALMRSSWTDPRSIYVGFKGGSPSTNHSHMDIGSFVMEADGIRWALDFGRQDYESLESKKINIWEFGQDSQRWKVFRYNNFAHNTLSVNNQLQDVKGDAPLLSFSDNPRFTHAIMDLSSVYPDLNELKRGVAIVNEESVAVRDEYTTGDKDCLIRWTMLTSAKVKLIGKRKAELDQGGKKLILKVAGLRNIRMKTWTTKSVNSFDADNIGTILLGFETQLKAGKKAAQTVWLLPQGGARSEKNRKLKISALADWKAGI